MKSTLFLLSSILTTQLQAATLRVQPDVKLELRAGPHSVSDINRQRYFRTYHIPGMFSAERAAEMIALGISPGRGTGPYLAHNGGDSERAGWSPKLEEQFNKYVEFSRKAKKRYPGVPYAMAGGNYPQQKKTNETNNHAQVDATMVVSHLNGVHPDDFERCIDLIDQWFDAIRQGGGSLPRYFSPLNEPDAAWKISSSPPQDHTDFARQMAIALKKKYPEVKISGPCTAWSHPNTDWSRWFKSGWERRFIETAGDVAGAYDFHFYSKEYWAYSAESPGFNPQNKLASPNLFEGLKNGNPYIWDFGKAEAYLDLIYAHHQATWGTPSLPVIISEFGRQGITPQKGPWASDYLYYLYGTTVTRMWMGFMDRPEIELTVPFILPESDRGHAPQRGQAMYTRPGAPDDMTFEPTPLLEFYEFFQGLEGDRVAIQWENITPAQSIGLFSIAARNGDELQVLLHNALPHPLEMNLDPGPDASVGKAHISRMRWEGDVPRDYTQKTDGKWRIDREAKEQVDLSKLILAEEETAIVKIKLSTKQPSRKITCERFYAKQTLQALGGPPTEFTIDLPENTTGGNATLVVGISAPNGFSPAARLAVRINGYDASAELGFTQGIRNMLVPIRIGISSDILKSGANTVQFRLNNAVSTNGTKITTARVDINEQNWSNDGSN